MTSAHITDVKNVLLGNVSNPTKGMEVQNTESFSKVFDKTQSPVADKKENLVKKVEDADSIQNHAKIQQNKTSEQLKEQTRNVKGIKKEEIFFIRKVNLV